MEHCRYEVWVHVGFALDKGAVGQVFLWALQFFDVSIVPVLPAYIHLLIGRG